MTDCNPKLTFNKYFVCTGADFSDVWNNLHNKIVPMMKNRCYNCGSHAEILFKSLHDHVNVGIGKNPKYPKMYESFVNEIVETHKNYNNRFTGFK